MSSKKHLDECPLLQQKSTSKKKPGLFFTGLTTKQKDSIINSGANPNDQQKQCSINHY
jgi:hypothetical protein